MPPETPLQSITKLRGAAHQNEKQHLVQISDPNPTVFVQKSEREALL